MSQFAAPYYYNKPTVVNQDGNRLLTCSNMICNASRLSSESSQNSLIHEFSFDKRHRTSESSSCSESDDMYDNDGRQTSCSGRCLLVPIILLIVLCCGFLACTIVLFLKVSEMENHIRSISLKQKDMNEMCVPCTDIQLGPFEEDNIQMREFELNRKNGLNVCCAKSPSQTSKLIDLLFLKRRKVECAKEFLNDQNSSCNSSNSSFPKNNKTAMATAHLLVGLQNPSNSYGKGPVPIRNWSSADPVAHASGLILRKDRIKINASGLYFLYSQVYFTAIFSDGRHKANESLTIYHYMYRYNVIYPNGGEQLLFKSVKTECWAKTKEYSDFTSYTGGAIFLNAGDEVYIKVSDVSLISRDSKASFIGMFRIS